MGYPVIGRIDEAALHSPDLTIGGMDMVTGPHLCLTQRNNVLNDHPPVYRRGPGIDKLARADDYVCLAAAVIYLAARGEFQTFHQVAFLSVLKLVEVRARTAQPDFADRSLDQVKGNKPPGLPPVPRLDD
jgi:hypothetical protein